MSTLTKIPLDLSHKSLITDMCSKLSLQLSEYNFSNLYLFRKTHLYSLLLNGASPYAILGTSYTKETFLMPLFVPEDWSELIVHAKAFGARFLFPIPEAWIPSTQKNIYPLSFHDAESDYLYEVEKIATYRGRHLDGQRNAVRSFLSSHTVTFQSIEESDSKNLLHIVTAWETQKDFEKSDVEACVECFTLWKTLGLEGLLFEVDSMKQGFIIGEPLTNDTFLIHFAKTAQHIKGLYQYMYQEFAKKLLPRFKWLNWEQDLGLPSLRHSKQEYHPAALLKKGHLDLSY